jgi:hypothetical protein
MRTPFRPTPERSYSLDGLITLTLVKFRTVVSKPESSRRGPVRVYEHAHDSSNYWVGNCNPRG